MTRCALLPLFFQLCNAADPCVTAAELEREAAEHYYQSRYQEAAHLQERALELRKELPQDRTALATAHTALALFYLALGKLRAAESEAMNARCFEESLTNPGDRARIAILLANIYFQTRQYDRSERELRAVLPTVSGQDRATALSDLGMIRAARGDLLDARRLLEESEAIPGTTQRGRRVANLALICFRQGDLLAANRWYRAALPLMERELGAEHQHVGIALAEYSQVLRKSGKKSEAKVMEQRARIIFAAAPMRLQTIDIRSLR